MSEDGLAVSQIALQEEHRRSSNEWTTEDDDELYSRMSETLAIHP